MKPQYTFVFLLTAGVLFLVGCTVGSIVTPTPGDQATDAVPTVTQPTTTKASTFTPTPAGAWIQPVPETAGPGDQILVEGYLPGGPTAAEAQENGAALSGYICWQSCLTGLVIKDLPVAWSQSEPGRFSIPFSVPSIPWLGADGPHPLTPGDYTLGVQCLGLENFGCATHEAQATATLHLKGPVPERCQAEQPCLELALSRGSARPGEQVEVTGWAPLATFGYALVIVPEDSAVEPAQLAGLAQQPDGSLSGSFQVPQQVNGLGDLPPGDYHPALRTYTYTLDGQFQSLLLVETPFTIDSGLSWALLELGQPHSVLLAENRMQPPQLTVEAPDSQNDPGESMRMAYCAPGEMRVSLDLGLNWTAIPTSGVTSAAQAAGYPLFQNPDRPPPSCISVSLDPVYPHSYYAVFETAQPEFGAPPLFFMGFTTADDGATWKAVSAPSPDLTEHFGGFTPGAEGAVQAIFGRLDLETGLVILQTQDGGLNWAEADLVCPFESRCLRWGPAGGSIGGMGSPLPQQVVISTDRGHTWSPAGPSAELRMPGPKELVFFSSGQALLLGAEFYPAQLSQDGGQTWEVLSLPGMPNSAGDSPTPEGLQILPDGSLLSFSSQDGNWALLLPGASDWCPLAVQDLPGFPVLFQPAGDRVWWLSTEHLQLQELSLERFTCGS
ncbi:MAG TPA: sialidase family protein [Anaerolineales bacterium]|nr:sialidase family protein [Anaerolineales bacterium]